MKFSHLRAGLLALAGLACLAGPALAARGTPSGFRDINWNISPKELKNRVGQYAATKNDGTPADRIYLQNYDITGILFTVAFEFERDGSNDGLSGISLNAAAAPGNARNAPKLEQALARKYGEPSALTLSNPKSKQVERGLRWDTPESQISYLYRDGTVSLSYRPTTTAKGVATSIVKLRYEGEPD